MSSKKSKSGTKKTSSRKSDIKPTQTVLSMFSKQKNPHYKSSTSKRKSTEDNKVNIIDSDDDDFKIVKVESKSKYFKSNSSDNTKEDEALKDESKPSLKRRLSLRSSKGKFTSVKDLDQVTLLEEPEVSQGELGSSQKENAKTSHMRSINDDSLSESRSNVNISNLNKSDSLKMAPISPSKKLSLLKRKSSGKKTESISADVKQRKKSSRRNTEETSLDYSVIEITDKSNESSSSITDEGSNIDDGEDDDDFKVSIKRLKSNKKLKNTISLKRSSSSASKLKKKMSEKKSEDRESNTTTLSKSVVVSSVSRENSKKMWNNLFQSMKKKEDNVIAADDKVTDTCIEESDSQPSSNTDNLELTQETKKESEGKTDGPVVVTHDETSKQVTGEAPVEPETEGEPKYRIPYYLENFRTILTAVLADEDNVRLFDEVDMQCIETFNSLSEPGQKLYVRLFSRKLAWLPVSKISYPEIGADLTEILQELIDKKLVMSESELTDLEQTLKVMSATDLKTLAKSFHINGQGLTKPQICDSLQKKSKQSTVSSMFTGGGGKGAGAAMLARAKKLLGRSVRLLDEPRRVFVRVLMLFSIIHSSPEEDQGNGGQRELYQMLLVNMGKVVYPEFTINKQTCLIKDREGLLRFERAMQYDTDLSLCVEKNNWTGAYDVFTQAREELEKIMEDQGILRTLPRFLRSCTAGSVLTKVCNQGIEILQRRKDYPGAVELIRQLLGQDLYCRDYHGYWWERLALNLEVHLKKPLEALESIGKGLADENVKVGHRLALYLRAEKLCTSTNSKYKHRMKEFSHEEVTEAPKVTLEGRVLPHSVPGLKYSFMTEDSYVNGNSEDVTVCAVEEFVMSHYKSHGYPEGLHAEGSIISNLFNLYFWDVVYMDVPDAFHSPYQTHPLDFQNEAFYTRRKEQIDDKLKELEEASEEKLHSLMAVTWESHYGKMCAGLNWERFKSLEHAQGLVSCIQGKLLSGMLRRYATNPRHTRSGFPDLTLWNTDSKVFKICEVKGPGDRLSHKQILWLDYLLKLGVDAEVCYVKAVGAKKLKPVATTSDT